MKTSILTQIDFLYLKYLFKLNMSTITKNVTDIVIQIDETPDVPENFGKTYSKKTSEFTDYELNSFFKN